MIYISDQRLGTKFYLRGPFFRLRLSSVTQKEERKSKRKRGNGGKETSRVSVSTVLELHWHCQIKVQSGVHHGKLARSRPQQLGISPIPNLLSSLHMARFMSPQNLSLRTDYCTKHWEILCLSRRRNGADSFDLRIVALAHAAANDGCCM
jgi:hypothetical protein